MLTAKLVKTPLASRCKLISDETTEASDPGLYRNVVGALQYITITHPNIAYTINKLYQFMHRPLEEHWKTTKRVLRYLKGTLDYGLHFKASQPLDIMGYSDSNWATDLTNMRSTTCYCLYLGSNIVSWQAKKQKMYPKVVQKQNSGVWHPYLQKFLTYNPYSVNYNSSKKNTSCMV
uniref:Retrovirus-related Pol polyprotein from transposon TNT 1-94 n=1 Tax=Cajanus cajan TaxID=3821 RepID=A0A151U3T3_CAJCA|nr:hypothetical protein KK1_006583 [Cajanus cajan]